MDDNIIDIKKFKKKEELSLDDPEVLKVWNFTGDIESAILEALKKDVDYVQIAGVMANRLGEVIRCIYQTTNVDVTPHMIEMIKRYSK
jgi:hypothetical protein